MVKPAGKNFRCEACNLVYRDEKTAKSCEDFCRKNHACNMDIIKLALKRV
jgi:hypothetical protein